MCLIKGGFDMEVSWWVWTVQIQRANGVECDVTCGLRCQSKKYIFDLRNGGS